jgi:homoaconitate hydratase family protein/3-isopropylmalate dehydratase small subunit
METIIEKILARHAGRPVKPGDIVDVEIDVRVARDFGGASVVKNLQENNLGIAAPARTFFTFDCNPGGSDQKYAANQQKCRTFAQAHGIKVYDVDAGIGSHLAIDLGLLGPGGTLVSTDSHANLLGAIGAFGQGMGDQDVAHAFAFGRTWFEVPKSLRIVLNGKPGPHATAKDIVLALLKRVGAAGLLDYSAELYGSAVEHLTLDQRITIASMATEMGAITLIIPPNQSVIDYCRNAGAKILEPVWADSNARYDHEETVDIEGLEPMISLPGHPEDVVPVSQVAGRKVDSCFIGSCTNGRIEDLRLAADILKGHRLAPGVVLKIVPATDRIWQECLKTGLMEVFKQAGALVGNAGCAGCAAGQIGQNGPGEVTVSTGNRNFSGKQGAGKVYLASPATAAASAVAGVIATADEVRSGRTSRVAVESHGSRPSSVVRRPSSGPPDVKAKSQTGNKPTVICSRAWVIAQDNIDTDMIYHNRYLTVTNLAEMGQYTFVNLKGWEDFAKKVRPGDIVVTGKNFGAGSSRQQAVDCFISLGVSAIVAESFGAIYKRNAINAALPIVTARLIHHDIHDGDEVEIDFRTGAIKVVRTGENVEGAPFSDVQLSVYQKGGLLHQ